jgi:hypothetical protein
VRFITSGEGLRSLRLGYEAPLGTSGLRGSAYASDTRYDKRAAKHASWKTASARSTS